MVWHCSALWHWAEWKGLCRSYGGAWSCKELLSELKNAQATNFASQIQIRMWRGKSWPSCDHPPATIPQFYALYPPSPLIYSFILHSMQFWCSSKTGGVFRYFYPCGPNNDKPRKGGLIGIWPSERYVVKNHIEMITTQAGIRVCNLSQPRGQNEEGGFPWWPPSTSPTICYTPATSRISPLFTHAGIKDFSARTCTFGTNNLNH